MFINQTLADEIRKYILGLLQHDSKIVGLDGFCLSSSDEKEIGKKLNISDSFLSVDEPIHIELNNADHVLMPLIHEGRKVFYLLIEQSNVPDAEKYFPLIENFVELVIQQFYEKNKPILDSTDQFIIKLLNNSTGLDLPFYESEAKALGYDVSIPRLAIVIHLNGFWENCLLAVNQASFERDQVISHYKGKIEFAINGFFSKNSDIIIGYIGNDKFVVYKAAKDGDINQIMKFLKMSYNAIFDPLKNTKIKDYTIGFSNPYSGIAGLISSFREADLSIEFGQKTGGVNKSYYFGDLGILSVIGQGDPVKNLDFANRLLKNLTNKELLATLDSFLKNNLNLTETADDMGVHRNTVIYRLNQITELIDADPRIFDEALKIKIALLIKKLFE